MIHRYRRPWLLVGIVAGLLVAPSGALAAVETDAVLTVRFVDAETLLPVGGADVHVTARQGDVVVAELDGVTDDTGTAILTALPRETGEGDAVVVDVVASKDTSFTDEESGCTFADSWDAERLGVVVDGVAIGVDFTADEQSLASSIACPPGEEPPTQQVGGAIGTPGQTLPATDALAEDGPGAANGAIVAALLAGLAAGILFVTPRRRVAIRARR